MSEEKLEKKSPESSEPGKRPVYYGVNDLYESIQGEGVKAGVPMIVLRLQGCAVGCVFCDTKETWERDSTRAVSSLSASLSGRRKGRYGLCTADEIVEQCLMFRPSWVMLTGGEPAEQDLGALIKALHCASKSVALETSGTALGHLSNFQEAGGEAPDWISVSPKLHGKVPFKNVTLIDANEIKWIVGKEDDIDEFEQFLLEHQSLIRLSCVISVQPVSLSPAATKLCVEAAFRDGYNVSLQAHKYAGLK